VNPGTCHDVADVGGDSCSRMLTHGVWTLESKQTSGSANGVSTEYMALSRDRSSLGSNRV